MEDERNPPISNKPRTVICVGDIHGQFVKLRNLWNNLESSIDPSEFASALVIFLGDYCDRGPDTRKVIDFLISLPGKYSDQRHVFLAGNHDFAFSGFLGLLTRPGDGSEFKDAWKAFEVYKEYEGWYEGDGYEDMHVQARRWAGKIKDRFNVAKGSEFKGSVNDAGPTFESYGVPHGSADLRKAVPDDHKKFLANLVWVHDEDDVCIKTEDGLQHCRLIAVHAGLESVKNVDDQLKFLRSKDTRLPKAPGLGGREGVWDMPKELAGKSTIVVSGHHGKLHMDGLRWIIDECSGFENRSMAAIVLPSRKIIRDTDCFLK